MLRITQHRSATAVKNYYRQEIPSQLVDYYRNEMQIEPDVIGYVEGKVADLLGVRGTLTEKQFSDLVAGIHPATGESLNKRVNKNGSRRAGIDLYIDLGGKSFSTYFAATKDPLVLEIFDRVEREFMREEVEPRMHVRVRQDGQDTTRQVSNAMWSSFTEITTRPTRIKDKKTGEMVPTGTTDPHFHKHIYVYPYAWDSEYRNRDGSKGAIMAAEMGKGIWDNAALLSLNFDARLAKAFREAGFNIRRTEHGIDLVGWNEALDKTFSRRKHEVEAWAKKKNITDLKDKSKGGKATRLSKSTKVLELEEQFHEWRERLPEASWREFLKSVKGDDEDNWPKVTEKEAVDYALAHVLQRQNSARVEEILYAAIDRGLGSIDVTKLESELLSRDNVISAKIGHDVLVTTKEQLAVEQEIRNFAIHSQGTRLPLGSGDFQFTPFYVSGGKRATLNRSQQQAVQLLLGSTSAINTLKGSPGVGKTTALTQLFRGVEENGGQVVALASTSNARDVMIADGKESGSVPLMETKTLARFLYDEQLQSVLNPHSLIVLDEATLASLADVQKLVQLVQQSKARLLLVGDERQMQSVNANANIFGQLHQLLRTSSAEINHIVRQRDKDYRRAVSLSSSADPKEVQKGFDQLVELGFVQEYDKRNDRLEQAAETYMEITSKKTSNRGKRLSWTIEEKQNPAMYRSGMTVFVKQKGKKASKLEVIGRDHGQVMVLGLDENPEKAKPFDLSKARQFSVYAPKYADAMVVVGTHREGEKLTSKIREARKKHGELGIEHQFERMENLSFSDEQKTVPEQYKPGMIIEFAKKAKAKRADNSEESSTIWSGERLTVTGRENNHVLMQNDRGERLALPTDLGDRFDVYVRKTMRVAVGDRIRMTKNGHFMPKAGAKRGVRFSNNAVFEVKGFDQEGNLIVGNDHRLARDFAHHRSGYYKTAMASQGATASHLIYLDSKEAGKSRSMESYLVGISRGKHATTLITDDMRACRNYAITRSSQRPSATQLAELAASQSGDTVEREMTRLSKQQQVLERVSHFAKQAVDATMRTIAQTKQHIADKANSLLPEHSPSIQEPAV